MKLAIRARHDLPLAAWIGVNSGFLLPLLLWTVYELVSELSKPALLHDRQSWFFM